MLNLSMPIPKPAVGGIPYSIALKKSSSKTIASSSPLLLNSNCSSNLALWSIGSFNSENALQYAPRIAAYVRELNYDRERMQNPYHIEKQHLKERHYDETTKQYTDKLGAGYTVQKIMPSPFRLNVTADIFSTNRLTKYSSDCSYE